MTRSVLLSFVDLLQRGSPGLKIWNGTKFIRWWAGSLLWVGHLLLLRQNDRGPQISCDESSLAGVSVEDPMSVVNLV